MNHYIGGVFLKNENAACIIVCASAFLGDEKDKGFLLSPGLAAI
jgi:hypothetical protein